MKTFLKLSSAVALSAFAFHSVSSAAVLSGNGRSGFGGPVGGGSLTITDDGTDLSFTFTRGSGDFNDFLVIYFDTVSGGATSLPTSGEIGDPFAGRRAIVNEFGSGVTFTSFGSDYAFALKSNGSVSNHLFTTPSGANADSLGFVSTHTVSNFGSASASSYSWTIPVSSIGLTANSGATFKLITTYLNPNSGFGSDASFRSNEAFGSIDPGSSNVEFSDYTFTTFDTYTIVPEPTTAALMLSSLGFGSLVISRRRSRR